MEGETERYSNGITKQIGMNEKKKLQTVVGTQEKNHSWASLEVKRLKIRL